MTLSALAAPVGEAAPDALIVDTHQHLWDLSKFDLAWVKTSAKVYQQSYRTEEYLAATAGLNVRAVYMEVDVGEAQRAAEAEHVLGLCRDPKTLTVAAVIGGHPDAPGFSDYVKQFNATGKLRGVRQVLHGSLPAGHCLNDAFVKGVRFLGTQNLSFDLCMRPKELGDGVKLAEQCPDTRLILDHCGNADPVAFGPGVAGRAPAHEADQWKRDIDALAKRPNLVCKVSGVVARAAENWKAEQLAPIVNHCLDAFGPDRVVFGSDWPVCLTRATFAQWVGALKAVVANRPAEERRKLWSQNAVRLYRLEL